MVRTAGIDLSSQDERTAACVISWGEGAGRIESLQLGVNDARILALIGAVDKAGIDVPFGWPAAFVEAVGSLGSGGEWPASYGHADTAAYRYRRTDLNTWRTVGGPPPLSVSTDRIGIPAMRAAALLSRIKPEVDRSGLGRVVEVYPAAALRRWGLSSSGYKRAANREARATLLHRFLAVACWLEMSTDQQAMCRGSDDLFDSVVAACVARAAAVGLAEAIPEAEVDAARREGWIAIPTEGSLALLGAGVQADR